MKILTRTLFLWAAFNLFACTSHKPYQKPGGPSLRVLTYNVNYGMPAPAKVLGAILSAKADIVFLQETNPRWEYYLQRRLSRDYPHIKFFHGSAAGGMAILSKFPFAHVAWRRPKAGWFPGWTVRAETPIGPLQFLSVHLRPPVPGGKNSTMAGAYIRTKPIRRQEIQELYKSFDPGIPSIVLGDFNEEENGQAVQWLMARGFRDALSKFEGGGKTWEWRVWFFTLSDRLDHIMYSRELNVLEARVLNVKASDHYPVLAVLEKE